MSSFWAIGVSNCVRYVIKYLVEQPADSLVLLPWIPLNIGHLVIVRGYLDEQDLLIRILDSPLHEIPQHNVNVAEGQAMIPTIVHNRRRAISVLVLNCESNSMYLTRPFGRANSQNIFFSFRFLNKFHGVLIQSQSENVLLEISTKGQSAVVFFRIPGENDTISDLCTVLKGLQITRPNDPEMEWGPLSSSESSRSTTPDDEGNPAPGPSGRAAQVPSVSEPSSSSSENESLQEIPSAESLSIQEYGSVYPADMTLLDRRRLHIDVFRGEDHATIVFEEYIRNFPILIKMAGKQYRIILQKDSAAEIPDNLNVDEMEASNNTSIYVVRVKRTFQEV